MWKNVIINIKLLCLLLLVSTCYGDISSKPNCNLSKTKSIIERLKRHLLCDYDKTVRPITNRKTAVNVNVSIDLLFLDLNEKTHTMNLHCAVILWYKDEHLKWNSEDFDGIKELSIKASELWTPDLIIYNSGDTSNLQVISNDAVCFVSHSGKIRLVSIVKLTSRCRTDFTYWPYDKQKCTIVMGSNAHSAEEIDFNFRTSEISTTFYDSRNDWKITNYTAETKNVTNIRILHLNLYMEKHSSIVHAVFIIPSIVLMHFTLIILWLELKLVKRITLAAINFICHILCINNLYFAIPSNGDKGSPHILLFYLDSFVLAMFSMIVIVVSGKLRETRITPPNWVLYVLSLVESNQTSRLLLFENGIGSSDSKVLVNVDDVSLSNQTDTGMNTSTRFTSSENSSENFVNKSWNKFTIMIEWIALIFVFCSYMFLIIVLMPKD